MNELLKNEPTKLHFWQTVARDKVEEFILYNHKEWHPQTEYILKYKNNMCDIYMFNSHKYRHKCTKDDSRFKISYARVVMVILECECCEFTSYNEKLIKVGIERKDLDSYGNEIFNKHDCDYWNGKQPKIVS